jgi:hypothetical protein
VGAGVTSVANAVIDDLRRMANGLIQGGWIYDSVNPWAYVSATSFKVAGIDVTSQFPKGTRIAIYQSGAIQYYYVTSSTFSTDTTVNIDGGGTYTLANVPIDRPAYSYTARPVGFPYASISEPLNWFQEIGRTTLGVAGDAISVQNLPPRKYLKVQFSLLPSGAITPQLRLNNDSSNNYAERYLFSGTFGNSINVNNVGNISNGGAVPVFGFMEIVNTIGAQKHGVIRDCYGDNAPGTAPDMIDFWFKWCNNAPAINRIDLINSGVGDFAIGSEVVVLGHD